MHRVVVEARRYGADVEGEIEGFKRTEEMTGDEAQHVQSLETVVDFVRATGSTSSPRHRQRHGTYKTAPTLDAQRVTDIVEATGKPVASTVDRHEPRAVQRPDRPGCAKVNISTALKIAFMKSGYDFMTEHPGDYDPPKLFTAQRTAVMRCEVPHPALRQRRKAWT